MSVLVEILAAALYLVLDLFPWGSDRRRDRRLLREGRARCGLRAVSGRVLDIPAEWSAGTCAISTGRLRFTPRSGIVGDRDVEVLEVLSTEFDPRQEIHLGLGDTVTYVLRTAGGELFWVLPAPVAAEASDLLFAPA